MIPACFSQPNTVSSNNTSNHQVPQNLITCIYQTHLCNSPTYLTLTWSKTPSSHSLTIYATDSFSITISLSPSTFSFFKSRPGSKSIYLTHHHYQRIKLYWDFTRAEFTRNSAEPDSGFYVAISCNAKLEFFLGDLHDELTRRSGLALTRQLSEPTLLSRREHVFGRRNYVSRAQFLGTKHEIGIECSGGVLKVKVDGEIRLVVKRLAWKFRGNEKIYVGGIEVEFFWDVFNWVNSISISNSNSNSSSKPKIVTGSAGYVLEDVPHLTDYIPHLPTYSNPLQDNPAYSVVKQYFVNVDDTVAQKIVVHKNSPRGTHFRRAGPRQRMYFESDDVHACIVTCGGLCPGLNTVIREIVCGLHHMYGVKKVLGIDGGYRGFYARNTVPLTPKVVNDIHKRGGTILGTSRGGHNTSKIVDSIQDRGINQVYIIGGDGTQKGASVIFEEIRRRGLKVAVAGIPKTIDNDIPVIDKSFGFDTAVEEAQRAINAAHVESESIENGIGVVKLMGRYSGFIAMHATLASRDVDCCLIPELPFYLEGPGGLFEYIEKRLRENGHMVLVIAEGAGQDLLSESIQSLDKQDASGNKLLQDVGLWISQKIKDHFSKQNKMVINLKYIDPTYMIRAIPSNASDNVYCTLLAQSAVHGAMAGYTGFTVGPVNGRHSYIPFYRIIEKQNKVVITDRMWARLLSSTNQPSFLSAKDVIEDRKEEELSNQMVDEMEYSDDSLEKKVISYTG